MAELTGRRIAVEIQFGDCVRIVTGRIKTIPSFEGDTQLSIQLDGPGSIEGRPILNVQWKYVWRLENDHQFGCDYFLSLLN